MIEITGNTLTIENVIEVARNKVQVALLSEKAYLRMESCRSWIEDTILQNTESYYGVNTGVGSLVSQRINPTQASILSRNIVLSCAAGIGEPLSEEIVRAMLLIRANSLAMGYSGVRPLIVNTLIKMLNNGVVPYIPAKGSVGASGDLAPLAHLALVLSRDSTDDVENSGQAWFEGVLMSGKEAMTRAGIPRVILKAKEGSSLTNGTTLMVSVATIAQYDSEILVKQAEITAAMSLEGLLGFSASFDPATHRVNGQPGQIETSDHIRALIGGSSLVDSRVEQVQDAYSLRCIPQVIGSVRDVLSFLRKRLSAAINAPCDNPLIFEGTTPENPFRVISGGNFHGEGLAMWLDFLGIAMAELGSISERRTFRLLTPDLNAGLPAMLISSSELNSGLMVTQVTAAALVSDNKTLAHPDSVDSIPTSANQEDFVSMGANSARHALEILSNVRIIIAIELLAATQAIDLRLDGGKKLGLGTLLAYQLVRKYVSFLEHDRPVSVDIQLLADLLARGELLKSVQKILKI
jgi:histidine ammonia-lyase